MDQIISIAEYTQIVRLRMYQMTRQKIVEIIESVVCTACPVHEEDGCIKHYKRCFDMYNLQAQKIMQEIIKEQK
jgi:Ribonuclease G/E